MESVLRVRDLTVCYGSLQQRTVTALSGVSFELAPGEAVGILGESGCGKTTLALALLGLLPHSAAVHHGAIIFRGTDILTLGERDLQKVRGSGISLVHQEPGLALNPVLRVGDQVAEVLRAHKGLSTRQAREESKELVAQVGFAAENRMDEAFPHQLEGPAHQVLGQPLHPYTQGLLQCGLAIPPSDSAPRPYASIPGEPPNLAALPPGCAFAPRCPERMEVCSSRPPSETHPDTARCVRCFKYE